MIVFVPKYLQLLFQYFSVFFNSLTWFSCSFISSFVFLFVPLCTFIDNNLDSFSVSVRWQSSFHAFNWKFNAWKSYRVNLTRGFAFKTLRCKIYCKILIMLCSTSLHIELYFIFDLCQLIRLENPKSCIKFCANLGICMLLQKCFIIQF